MVAPEPRSGQITLTSRPVNISVPMPESDADGDHRRRQDIILFVGSLSLVAVLALVAAWAAFLSAGSNAKQQEWGMGVLLIAGVCVGYPTGKGAK